LCCRTKRACTITLPHNATHCNILEHATHCNILEHIAKKFKTLQEITTPILFLCAAWQNGHQYTLQDTATHCTLLQHIASHGIVDLRCRARRPSIIILQYTNKHCNKLQHATTHCNTMQHHTAYCFFTLAGQAGIYDYIAIYYNTLQLQHTATHYNTLCCSVLQFAAVCCSVLQCVAVCCSVL